MLLADHLVQRARPHPGGERRDGIDASAVRRRVEERHRASVGATPRTASWYGRRPRARHTVGAVEILRYAAFSADPAGGNPAGVVLDATGASDADMLAVAAEVGFSETAFLFPRGERTFDARYFSPLVEIPFCGHATIAAAVAYAERHGHGTMALATRGGRVDVTTGLGHDGRPRATLMSVPPRVADLADADLLAILDALDWDRADLDTALPARVAYAGAWHPIIAASSRSRLAKLDYDFDALGALMTARDWTTIDLVWRESPTVVPRPRPVPARRRG